MDDAQRRTNTDSNRSLEFMKAEGWMWFKDRFENVHCLAIVPERK